MITGNAKEEPRFTLGQMELDLTTSGKNYRSGQLNSTGHSRWPPLQEYKNGNNTEAGHHLLDTYHQLWRGNKETQQTEKKKLKQMLDNIIKRILMTSTSTPREALCIETGLLAIETTDYENKISMGERLGKNANSHMPGGINPKGKILDAFKTRIKKEGENKSKINLLEGNEGWTLDQQKCYMLQLGRTQASTISKAHTRMLHVKNNYKNDNKDLTCRAYQKENETQKPCTYRLPGHPPW